MVGWARRRGTVTGSDACVVSTKGRGCKVKTKCLCNRRECSLQPAASFPVSWGASAGAPRHLQHLTFSSHHWQGQAFPYSQSHGVSLCALFWWLWVGLGCVFFFSFFFFLFFSMALHEKCSIKFCISLQGPIEPNLKSAECVWSCPGWSPHIGYFLKAASVGLGDIGKTHCKMQAYELESCFLKSQSQAVIYCMIAFT